MFFPPVETASKEGILISTFDISEELVIAAYQEGIFPWPLSSDFITWFAPPKRAVLFIDKFRVNRSLERSLRKYHVKFNSCFEDVINFCAEVPRKHQSGTWITEDIKRVYIGLHKKGHAFSVDVFDDQDLVGGLYGVNIGDLFAAESMFHLKPNASKVALYYLVELLKRNKIKFLDCQVINPFLKTLGVEEIPRAKFMELLESLKGLRF